MKDYSDEFKSLHKVEIDENKEENKTKKWEYTRKAIIAMCILYSGILVLVLNIPSKDIRNTNIDHATLTIVISMIFCASSYYLIKKVRFENVNEKLSETAFTFGASEVLKDILTIMYEHFPPFIRSNMENKIVDPVILKLLTPLVTTDCNGNLNIADVGLDYTEKRLAIYYQGGESKCYLKKIEFWPSRGKFKFHFDKVNPDLTVEKLEPMEFDPESSK